MPPDVIDTAANMREWIRCRRRTDATIGFVPTMGALHEGHARLISTARQQCSAVVVSIFVNPLQFDRDDDFLKYPRSLAEDLALCTKVGVHAVFVPSVGEMYPIPPACRIHVGTVSSHLCGKSRPGHFDGVATVVLKLLNIVAPDYIYLGEKDAQQAAVIRRLVGDFNLAVELVEVPTVREADGLACSSRNVRLTPAERGSATALYLALRAGASRIAAGETDVNRIKRSAVAEIPDDASLRLEYLDVVEASGMEPVERVSGPVRIAGALWVGSIRLIDNLRCEPN